MLYVSSTSAISQNYANYTIKIVAVTQCRQINPLHVEASGLQAVPKRTRCHTALLIEPGGITNPITVLQHEGV